jgi:hypothetical protein
LLSGACLFALLFLAGPAVAQLNLTITAEPEVTVSYDPGYMDYEIYPSLTFSTVATPPGFLNYSGVASGTFQMDFLAPSGYRYSVNPLDGAVSFNFWIAYTNYGDGSPGGLSQAGGGTVTFLGLQGAEPTVSINATMGDLPHAYLSVGVDAWEITTAFSFTGLRYTVAFDGPGNDVDLFMIEGGQITVTDGNYLGSTPYPAIFTVAAIPEPGTYAALAGLAALGAVLFRRRRAV